MPKPSLGRIIHYVLNEGRATGEHRPALIVRVWPSSVNLQVFVDGSNDQLAAGSVQTAVWRTSVVEDASGKPGTWHWPEREGSDGADS